jgi:hypothetical protein
MFDPAVARIMLYPLEVTVPKPLNGVRVACVFAATTQFVRDAVAAFWVDDWVGAIIKVQDVNCAFTLRLEDKVKVTVAPK